MRNALSAQFVRFLLVGSINTGFSYSVYAALLYIGLNYALANLGSLLLGILFSFRTQSRLVFRNKDDRLILRFAGVWALIFLVNILLISALIRSGLNAYWAGAFALVPVTFMSYFAQKKLVFGSSRPVGTDTNNR